MGFGLTAREMHYDFKQKLNAIDSQKYRNLKVPEIDWKLNEAQEIIVKTIAQPRSKSALGFEINQRSIDDIRTLVIEQEAGEGTIPTPYGDDSFISTLPSNYWFYVNSKAYGSKGNCSRVELSTKEIRHDDDFEASPFDKSSFDWRTVNLRFNSQGVRLFTDGTFSIDEFCVDYIKKPRAIHNAQDYVGGTYTDLKGNTLTGSSDCELSEGIHKEIVDIAVFITAGDLNLPGYQMKQNKLRINN